MTRPSPTSPTQRVRLLALAALGLLAAALGLAACGGSSSDPLTKPSAATASTDALHFGKCMREHGVNVETSTAGGEGFGIRIKNSNASPRTMESAQNACKHFLPNHGEPPKLTPQEEVAREEAVRKFAKCMREHGIKVEAEAKGGAIRIGIHGSPGAGGLNPESPAFQDAQKACSGLLPGGGPKGGLPHHIGAPPGGAPSPRGSGSGQESSESTLAAP